MVSAIVPEARIQALNDAGVREGAYVLYWMQNAQRAEDNHALEYAITRANELGKPVVVGFGLTDDYPEANARHYAFMLEGLAEVEASLRRRKIRFVVRRADPAVAALTLAREAALVVCDRGYLRHQKAWRARVAAEAGCEVVQVETDVVVPVEVASTKAEYAARTLRPKLHEHLETFLVGLRTTPVQVSSLELELPSDVDVRDPAAVLGTLELKCDVPPVGALFTGGTSQAKQRLRRFLDERVARYLKHRNQPHTDDVSHMSMYLHFGQISPLYIALALLESDADAETTEGYLDELVVRRGLSMNFVHYRPESYDRFAGLPDWAKKTLLEHADDPRDPCYTAAQLDAGETHDCYWNAAMKEMRATGYMHNHMRMYWGKKILEWSSSPEAAYETALRLNNTYFLDGRDPNSFANVGWVFGLHDRPWGERAIFGKVRYMSAAGLERKTDPEAYVASVEVKVEALAASG